MQESCCQFISISPSLLIDQFNSTVPHPSSPLCLAGHCFFYGVVLDVMQPLYHGISHESLVFSSYTHPAEGSGVYQENTSDSWDIPQYILLENINIHHSFNKYLMNALHQAGINNRVYIVNEPR